jgi:hypothetical protein
MFCDDLARKALLSWALPAWPLSRAGACRDVAGLAGSDDEAQGATERIGEQVDLGRQSASGTPQRLVLRPLFRSPLAGARMMVLLIIGYWLSRSAVSASSTRSHTPAWHQRQKAPVHGLPASVALRQGAPVGARPQHPQASVHEQAVVPSRTARIARLAG